MSECKHNWKFADAHFERRDGYANDRKIYVFYCTKCGKTKQNSEFTNELRKHWWER